MIKRMMTMIVPMPMYMASVIPRALRGNAADHSG